MRRRETEATLKKRNDYIDAIEEALNTGDIQIEDLIFVDEAGSKLGMSSNYARAEGGDRVVVSEPKSTGKNISIIGALGITGVVAAMYCFCTVNASGFVAFIEKHLVPALRPGQFVILDNVNFHCSQLVRELIESAGCRVVFLPPYSPELNPIENMWSKIKAFLKSKMPKSLEDYHDSLSEAFSQIDDYGCEGWFRQANYILY